MLTGLEFAAGRGHSVTVTLVWANAGTAQISKTRIPCRRACCFMALAPIRKFLPPPQLGGTCPTRLRSGGEVRRCCSLRAYSVKRYSGGTDWSKSQTTEILAGLHLATLEPSPERVPFSSGARLLDL